MILPHPLRASLALLAVLAAFWTVAVTQDASAQPVPPSSTVDEMEATKIGSAEAVRRLLDVLRDDTARAELISRLEAEAAAQPAQAPDEAVPATLAQDLAANTAATASSVMEQLSRVGSEFGRLSLLYDRLTSDQFRAYRAEALALVMTILSTVFVHLGLGIAVARLARRVMPRVGAGVVARARGAGIVLAARLGSVAAALVVGYALSAFVFAPAGLPSDAQSLYLNAFAIFGLFRAVLRLLVSPRADHEPSLSSQAPGAQAVIYRWLRVCVGTLIQGFLFVVPLAHAWVGFAAARSLRTLIATLAAVLALIAIRKITGALDASRGHQAPSATLTGQAGAQLADGAQSVWRKVWPPLAMLYVVYAWFISVSQPNLVEEIVLYGTGYSICGLGLLLLALKLLRAAPGFRAPLPKGLLNLMPRLGPRADRITAGLGWVLALLLAGVAVGLVLEGWNWVDFSAGLAGISGQSAFWNVASAGIVVFCAAAFWAIVASWIDSRLTRDLAGGNASARSRTLLALFRNAFTVAIAIFATMITLSELGIDIAPLLAGAGVIGLAIGFGSQKLVQDIITGIFIQLENAMNEGDVVGVAGITGAVEKITIRSVRLRTVDGAAHIVPFSSVDTVTNLTRDYAYHVAEIGAAYKEKVSDVKAAMQEAFDRLSGEGFEGDIMGPLEMQGVIQLGDSAVVVRARIKTLPGKQWGIGRRYTELVKEVMDERGLEIPFPHRQLVFPPGTAPMLPKPEGEH